METTFKLPDMTCNGCVRKVVQAVQRVDPQAEVKADLPAQQVQVESQASRDSLAQALRDAGFEPA